MATCLACFFFSGVIFGGLGGGGGGGPTLCDMLWGFCSLLATLLIVLASTAAPPGLRGARSWL